MRIVHQVGALDGLAEARPLLFGIDADNDRLVAGRECLKRRNKRMTRSNATRNVTGIQVTRDCIFQDRDLRIEHRDVDLRAAAGRVAVV
jgi:hypothetical protein